MEPDECAPDERAPVDTDALVEQGRQLLEQSRSLLRSLDAQLVRGSESLATADHEAGLTSD